MVIFQVLDQNEQIEISKRVEASLINKNIVLFDGVCNLCNGFIDFVIKRDKSKRIFYSSLQDTQSKTLVNEFGIQLEDDFSTIYYYSEGKIYSESTAILKIFKELSPMYRLIAKVGLVIPTFIRNGMYKVISKNRYFLFGKKNTCRIPTPEEKGQFI